jgi:hypothetical protein
VGSPNQPAANGVARRCVGRSLPQAHQTSPPPTEWRGGVLDDRLDRCSRTPVDSAWRPALWTRQMPDKQRPPAIQRQSDQLCARQPRFRHKALNQRETARHTPALPPRPPQRTWTHPRHYRGPTPWYRRPLGPGLAGDGAALPRRRSPTAIDYSPIHRQSSAGQGGISMSTGLVAWMPVRSAARWVHPHRAGALPRTVAARPTPQLPPPCRRCTPAPAEANALGVNRLRC